MSEQISETLDDVDRSIDDLVEEIIRIDQAMSCMFGSRLKRKTVVLLISHASGVAQRDVNRVIDALSLLRSRYVDDSD